MSKKFTIEEVKEIIKNKGFKLVNDEYINNLQKLTIQDSEGYLYHTTLVNIHTKQRNVSKFHKDNIYTIYNIKLFLKQYHPQFKLLTDEYEGTKDKIILCTEEGYKCIISLAVLIRGYAPAIFANTNPYTIENIKIWCNIHNKPILLLSTNYKSNTDKLTWKCLTTTCSEIFSANWDSVNSGRKCSYCSSKKVGLSNCLATKNPELAKEWHPTKNRELTPNDVTSGSKEKVWWQCSNNSQHEWLCDVVSRNGRRRGCPICKEYTGEILTRKQLINYNILFESQYKFEDCRYKLPLPFDFYIHDVNCVIEVQGIQHYEPIDFAGRGFVWAEQQFEKQKINDQIKRDYCTQNNIKLIEIPYWDFDNIEEILIKELKLQLNSNKINDGENTVIFNM